MRNPTRKISASTSQVDRHEQDGRARGSCSRDARYERASISMRTSRYASTGYTSGTDVKISPRLKKTCDSENDSSTSRSRWTSRSGRRQSKKGKKKASINGIHTHGAFTLRPNAPVQPARHLPRDLRAGPYLDRAPLTLVDDHLRDLVAVVELAHLPAARAFRERLPPHVVVFARARPAASETRAAIRAACTAFRKWSRGGRPGLDGRVRVASGRTAWLWDSSAACAEAGAALSASSAEASATGERRGAGLPKLQSLLPMKLSGVAARIAIAWARTFSTSAEADQQPRARSG